jgi:hypothetical protein
MSQVSDAAAADILSNALAGLGIGICATRSIEASRYNFYEGRLGETGTSS